MTRELPPIELKDFGTTGEQLLADYQTRVAASPQAPIARSAFDSTRWRGVNPGLDAWHGFVEASSHVDHSDEAAIERLLPKLSSIISDDIVFSPPTYWRTREGKMMAMWILKQVGSIFGTSFQYQRQLSDATGTNIMLEFSAMVDEIPTQEHSKPGNLIWPPRR